MARAAAPGSFLRSPQHAKLRKALAVIHAGPANAWSLDALADVAGMSRKRGQARFIPKSNLAPLSRRRHTSMSLPCTVWVVFERPGNEPRIHASARIGTHCSLDYRPAFHRLSSSALLITLTLLSAIAAPANTGLSMPNAASGMPTTL